MALLFFDSFDCYGTTNGTGITARPSPTGIMTKGRWNAQENISETRLKESLDIRGLSDNSLTGSAGTRRDDLTTNSILIAGVNLKQNGSFYSGTTVRNLPLFTLYEGTTASFSLRLCGSGLGVRLGTTPVRVVPFFKFDNGKNHFVEFKIFCHDTTGYYEIRVNGVKIHEETGIDTKNGTLGYYNRVLLGHVFRGIVDNFYICDASGSEHNDFLGPVRATMLKPTSEVTNTFNTGNYLDFDEEQLSIADYAECDGDAGQAVESGFEASPNYATILAVQVTGDLSSNVNTVVAFTANSSGNVTLSTNLATASTNINTYVTRSALFTEEPGTSNAWTPATVNLAAFGTEVQ